jgi:MFS family permease
MVFTQHHDIQDRPAAPLATIAPVPRRRRLQLPTTVAFTLLVSIVVSFLAGSSAPTPLYGVYQSAWGFSPLTITVVFGIYAVAVLVALLTAGTLSDHVGRRPVLVVALLLQGAAMVIFATAGGVPALLVARVVQGLSTGAAVGAVGAGLLDLDKTKGTPSPMPSRRLRERRRVHCSPGYWSSSSRPRPTWCTSCSSGSS